MTKKSLLLLAAFTASSCIYAQTAQIQLIHNAADPAAAAVDVYINGTLTFDDFAFREATAYTNVSAGVLLNVGIAPGNSTSVNDTLRNFPVILSSNGVYVAVANGVLTPNNFASNPDAVSTEFTVLLQEQMRTAANNSNEVDFRVVHGASDAPTVDVIARDVATLVDNAPYAAITDYISVPNDVYTLDLTLEDGSTVVNSYYADLSGLAGGSAVVFASGFLSPSANQNGAAFGIFAALADGSVVEFKPYAGLQVIHNAADPAAAQVDVYLNGEKVLDNFAFRQATSYLEIPPAMNHNIGIAAGNSMSVNDTLANFVINLAADVDYVALANGVLSPNNFAVNPDAASTNFTLFVQDNMRKTANNSNEVDFRIVHGASDAPTVDIDARGVALLADNASYGDITPYLSVPNANYTIDVKDETGTTTVASFIADLSGLAGGSAVVFASGFLTPPNNQNGLPFGIYAALTDGTVVAFPAETTSVNNVSGGIEAAIFPIPAQNEAFLRLNPADEVSSIQIADLTGKILQNIELKNNNELVQLPIENLVSGIYFVKISNAKGSSTIKMVRN